MTDTASTSDLRASLHRGDPVSQADFRRAEEREAAAFERVLADRRAAREARIVDPYHDAAERAAERAAKFEQARADREAEQDATANRIEQMRLARLDRHTPGGLPLHQGAEPRRT
jgi:hypothetical protein